MSTPMKLDAFLTQQTHVQDTGFMAVLEPIADRPDAIKVTPFHDDQGCGCASSLELPRTMIQSVTPTGKFHQCCGKRLEVVQVEFTENASVPVADLMRRRVQPHDHGHAVAPPGRFAPPPGAMSRSRSPHGLVGRFPIPWTPCTINCIEVCTEFCSDTGWDCCRWETRCGVNCGGLSIG